jgi:hypothetical protein
MLKPVSWKLRTATALVATGAMAITSVTLAQVAPAAPIQKAVPAAVASPQMQILQHDLDIGQYREAIKEASRLLELRGNAASGLSRFQITMMKGYAQVGAKLTSAGLSTFKFAVKETNDPREIALAKWTAELFQRSHGPLYAPRVIGAAVANVPPINLLDAEGRSQAFSMMLDSDLAELGPRIRAASASLSLVKIWPVIQQVQGLAELNVVADGTEDRVQAVAGTLLTHSRNLLASALKEMWVRTSDIDTHANVLNTSSVSTQDSLGNIVNQTVTGKNGLTDSNRADLQSIVATCAQIRDAAQAFGPLADNDKDWLSILADADRVAGRASDVLNTQYGNTVYANQTGLGFGSTGGYVPIGGVPTQATQLQQLQNQQQGNGGSPTQPVGHNPVKPEPPKQPPPQPPPTQPPPTPPAPTPPPPNGPPKHPGIW